jgi:hypothetical protein
MGYQGVDYIDKARKNATIDLAFQVSEEDEFVLSYRGLERIGFFTEELGWRLLIGIDYFTGFRYPRRLAKGLAAPKPVF